MPSPRPLFVIGSSATACLLFLASCGGGSDAATSAAPVVAAQTEQQVQRDNQSAPAHAYTATLLPALSSLEQATAGLSTVMGTGVVLVDPQRGLLRASVTTTDPGHAESGWRVTLSLSATGSSPTGADEVALRETAPGSGVWTVQHALNAGQLAALQAGESRFQLRNSNNLSATLLQGQVRAALPGGPLNLTAQLQQVSQAGSTTNTSSTSTSTSTSIDSQDAVQITRQDTQVSNVQSAPVDIVTLNGQAVGEQTVSGNASTNRTVRLTMLTNVMSSAQQVPAQQSPGVAISVVILDQVSGRMRASLTSLGVDGTAAHVHQGQPGVSGPILFSLDQAGAGSGIWSGAADLNATQVQAVLQGSYYLDLHTAAAPQGLLRGQILQQGGVVTITGQVSQIVRNDSNGRQEVTQGNSSSIQQ